METKKTVTENRQLLQQVIPVSPAPGQSSHAQASVAEILRVAEQHLRARRFREAGHLASQVLRALPELAEAKLLLAGTYHQMGRLGDCLPLAESLVAADPQNHQAWMLKASCLCDGGGDMAEAERAIRAAIRLAPAIAQYHNILTVIMNAAGNLEEARRANEATLRCDDRHCYALYIRSALPGAQTTPEEIRRMEGIAADPSLNPTDRLLLHHAVSSASRKAGDMATEFRHLRQANELGAAAHPWDSQEGQAELEKIIDSFGAEADDWFSPSPDTGERPVLIASMPRAGSTLTEQILAAHPDVTSLGESGVATAGLMGAERQSAFREGGYWRWLDAADPLRLINTARELMQAEIARRVPTSPVFIDKSINNDYMIGLWLLCFPATRVVHVVRHPLSICLSAYQANFVSVPFSHRLDWLATRYLQHERLMNFWKQRFPERIHTLRYEALVADAKKEIEAMLQFLGLPWHDACLSFQDSVDTVRTASNWQVREKLYTSSVDRWRPYRDYLQPAIDVLEAAGVSVD